MAPSTNPKGMERQDVVSLPSNQAPCYECKRRNTCLYPEKCRKKDRYLRGKKT